MDNTELMRKGIAALEKQTSLRQIGLQSGINYITLRKIKSGETKNVSSGVLARFEEFKNSFDPSSAAASKKKPGPKPKAAAAPAATAKKKPGPKPKAAAAPAAAAKKKPGPKPKAAAAPAAPVKKKPGPKPKAAAAAPAAPAKKKMGRPKKVVAEVAAAPAAAPAKKKPGRPKATTAKRGPKPAVKSTAAPKIVAEKASNFGTPILGDALNREIEIAEARIEYLKSLQMVEEEFLRAIGKL
ncbi:MAG: hypothetical protein WBQ23_11695 [Bacteroidota bacterium]